MISQEALMGWLHEELRTYPCSYPSLEIILSLKYPRLGECLHKLPGAGAEVYFTDPAWSNYLVSYEIQTQGARAAQYHHEFVTSTLKQIEQTRRPSSTQEILFVYLSCWRWAAGMNTTPYPWSQWCESWYQLFEILVRTDKDFMSSTSKIHPNDFWWYLERVFDGTLLQYLPS